jgi:hypothetical protein
VLVFEAPDNLTFNFKSGDPIRLGQALCSLDSQVNIEQMTSDNQSSLSTDDSESVDEDDPNSNLPMDKSDLEHSLLLETMTFDTDLIDSSELLENDGNDEHNSSDSAI